MPDPLTSLDLVVMDAVLRREKEKVLKACDNPVDYVKSVLDGVRGLKNSVALLVDAIQEEPMKHKKGQDTWTCSITFKVKGVPGKNKAEALDNFRKWIGNQLRDVNSKIRKRFLKLTCVEREVV